MSRVADSDETASGRTAVLESVTRAVGVFEGGGVRGIALAGAAAAALDEGIEFESVAGTSAGALVASLVIAGYEPEELSRAVCSVPWPDLLDTSTVARIPVLGKHLAIFLRKGFNRGRRLEDVWAELLERKGIRTFADLPPDALEVVVTDLSHHSGVVLPRDLELYGIDPQSFSVARALRMSAAVPFLFEPVALHTPHETVYMADGAMSSNFPVRITDRRRPVLGFVLRRESADHPHFPIRGPVSLARAVMVSGIRARYTLPRPLLAQITPIEVPVQEDLDFDLSPQDAARVFERGRRAAADQLRKTWEVSPT